MWSNNIYIYFFFDKKKIGYPIVALYLGVTQQHPTRWVQRELVSHSCYPNPTRALAGPEWGLWGLIPSTSYCGIRTWDLHIPNHLRLHSLPLDHHPRWLVQQHIKTSLVLPMNALRTQVKIYLMLTQIMFLYIFQKIKLNYTHILRKTQKR